MERTKYHSGEDAGFCIAESRFDPALLGRNESVFTLGNGSLGFRGDFEEGFPGAVEGVYLNGFYETVPIRYGELAYGYARNGQTMLNLANAKRIRIFLDDEELCLACGTVEQYERVLLMREGRLERSFEWRSPKGRAARVRFERLVALGERDVACIRCTVEPLLGVSCVRIESVIDANTANLASADDPRVGSGLERDALQTLRAEAWEDCCLLAQRTNRSGLAYACAARTQVCADVPVEKGSIKRPKEVGNWYACERPKRIILEKWAAYTHGTTKKAGLLAEDALAQAAEGEQQGIEALRKMQEAALDIFWRNTGLSIRGDNGLLQGLRFSLFQLYQSAGRDGKTNIAAKGLSGEGYEGHYFWDTETYIFPFFLYTTPKIARSLLTYRYSILEQARRRAREMGHPQGALFPWRTIGGEECSAYYPAGTAQYHINADIANAVSQYVQVTGDTAFMEACGVEMLVETARLWMDLGFYNSEKGGRFCINCVTGPDEYNVLVNNNCYTNLMAAHNMEQAAHWLEWLWQHSRQKAKALALRLALRDEESGQWRCAAQNMYLPYDNVRKLYMQDDAFMDRVPWPLEAIPQEKFPLLLHYHPLVIYRHRVCKQADLVLALLLRSECFSLEEKKNAFDFYEPLTTHDSSLSRAVFSIVASELGYAEKAYEYFSGAARLDLEDMHGNSKDGLHMANMAGAWMSIVYGFAGMRVCRGTLQFCPVIPKDWEQYGFVICWKGMRLGITVNQRQTQYSLAEGAAISFLHRGKLIELSQNQSVCEENQYRQA